MASACDNCTTECCIFVHSRLDFSPKLAVVLESVIIIVQLKWYGVFRVSSRLRTQALASSFLAASTTKFRSHFANCRATYTNHAIYWVTLVTLLTRHACVAREYTNVELATVRITHFCDHCWYGKPIAYFRYLNSCIAVYIPWCY